MRNNYGAIFVFQHSIMRHVDIICFRSVSDFPKFLGIAMETFLTLCDDPEADIRMVADECLNRSIKV